MGDLRLPADWEPHERCVMAWPGEESRPGSRAPEAIGDFALIARTIARFEPVLMLAYPEFVGQAEAACGPNVEVVELAFDDVWIRDSGPLFAVRGGKELVAVDFRFNRYGWRKVPRERYAETGVLLAERLRIPRVEVPYVLEGGAISTNGQGTLIAVESSILTETRNPGATRDDLEHAFAVFLGIEHTIWLEQGLEEDRTDGHADNVAVFVGPDRVLCQAATDPNDPNASNLAKNRAVLEEAGFEVVDLPVLPYSEHDDRRLARDLRELLHRKRLRRYPAVRDVSRRVRPGGAPRSISRPRSRGRTRRNPRARRRRGSLHHSAGTAGMMQRVDTFYAVMTTTRTLDTIRLEIERATDRRAELLHVLAEGHDAVVAAEHAEVEATIASLWDEYREARVRGRFGDRDVIIKRARLEERLDRAA